MTTAIYGGSFDPPHLGHVMVVTHLLLNLEEDVVDKILIVPCHKQEGKHLTAYKDRIAMARLAFSWLPRTEVSEVGAEIPDDSQTINLINHLVSTKPANYRWIMGADLQESAKTWDGWDLVAKHAPPLIVGRAGIAPLQSGDPTPISPKASSTIVRLALNTSNFDLAERYLPSSVLKYIVDNRLYSAVGKI